MRMSVFVGLRPSGPGRVLPFGLHRFFSMGFFFSIWFCLFLCFASFFSLHCSAARLSSMLRRSQQKSPPTTFVTASRHNAKISGRAMETIRSRQKRLSSPLQSRAISEETQLKSIRPVSAAVPSNAVETNSILSPISPVSLEDSVSEGGSMVRGRHIKDCTVSRSMYQTLHMAIADEMERDPTVCVLGEDVGHYGGSYKVTRDLHYRYSNFRCMDTPICENTFVGMAIGAAMNGQKPIVEGMNLGFLLLAFNQISNNACMVQYTSGGNFQVPIVIRGPGGIGKQLGPEHSQRIEAYLMAIPGLKMVACSTAYNARGLLTAAIRDNNPVVFFEHVLLYGVQGDVPVLPYTQAIDKAELVRSGTDLTILSYSRMRHVAAEAAMRLEGMGIQAEVLDLISLKPLDLQSIQKSLSKTHRCLILDESSKTGGIAGEIFTQVVENFSHTLDDIPVRLCSKDIPTPYSRVLEEITIVSPEDVVNAVLWMQAGRKGMNLEATTEALGPRRISISV